MSKRKLTPDEINDILLAIRPIITVQPDISENIVEKIRRNIEEQLKQVEIIPSKIHELKQNIIRHYYSSQINPGEHVGIVSAQNIGERCTQWTLDSFHYSGTTISTVVTGVPRFAELLSTTKNPKNVVTNLYFKSPPKTISETRQLIRNHIQQVLFGDLIVSHSISHQRKKWYDIYEKLYNNRYAKYNTCLSFKLNKEALFRFQLTTQDVAKKLEESYSDVVCVFSPTCMGIVDVWVNTSELELSDNINDVYIKENNKTYIYLIFVVLAHLKTIQLCGIPDITGLMYKQQNEEWYLELLGYNMYKIFELDFVNHDKTYSNNMWEIFEIFGIEAAREFLVSEFINVVSSDSFVNTRHIQLLVDTMCYMGSISSISRYGVHSNESGPLTKASFEESLDNFLKAGLFNEIETTNGVSASIMCGKPSKIGTGMCDLFYKN
jgi:DNA-directed RNA polymerase beta' subunit